MEFKLCLATFVLLAAAAIQLAEGSCSPPCVDDATCINGECKCDEGFFGDGTFRCYKNNNVGAEVRTDPTLTDFNNKTVLFFYPCRYLLTHVKTELKPKSGLKPLGQCETIASAFNGRIDGKIFVLGLDVAVRITFFDGSPDLLVSFRSFGTTCHGSSNVVTYGNVGEFLPGGVPSTDNDNLDVTINGVKISFHQDFLSGAIWFYIKWCGISIHFYPYDYCEKIRQLTVPGISIGVNCAHQPEWCSQDTVLALPPISQGGFSFSQLLPNVSISDSDKLLIRAFWPSTNQTQPYENEFCKEDPFHYCDDEHDLEVAASTCFWMLETPKFIKCVDGPGLSPAVQTLKLFNECVRKACAGNVAVCNIFKLKIQTLAQGCEIDTLGPVADFLGLACPFH